MSSPQDIAYLAELHARGVLNDEVYERLHRAACVSLEARWRFGLPQTGPPASSEVVSASAPVPHPANPAYISSPPEVIDSVAPPSVPAAQFVPGTPSVPAATFAPAAPSVPAPAAPLVSCPLTAAYAPGTTHSSLDEMRRLAGVRLSV